MSRRNEPERGWRWHLYDIYHLFFQIKRKSLVFSCESSPTSKVDN